MSLSRIGPGKLQAKSNLKGDELMAAGKKNALSQQGGRDNAPVLNPKCGQLRGEQHTDNNVHLVLSRYGARNRIPYFILIIRRLNIFP